MSEPAPARRSRFTQPEPAPSWDFLTVTNTIFILLIASLAGTVIAGVWLQGSGASFVLTGLLARAFGAVATLLFINAGRRKPEDRAALRVNSSPLPLPFVLLIGFGMAVVIDVVGFLVAGGGAFYTSVPELVGFFATTPTPSAWVIAAVYLVVLRPLAEGIVFFGVAFPWLRARLGAWAGLVITALLFGLYHLVAFLFLAPQRPPLDVPTLWYGLGATFLTGLLLGLLRAYTGSTRALIAAYAGFGIFALLKFVVAGGA